MITTRINRIYLAGLALLLSVTACDKQLDIQPQNTVDATQAITNAQDVESVIVGGYAQLDQPSLYGTNFLLLPDLLASEGYVGWQGTFTSYRDVSLKEITPINAEATRTWTRAYWAINTVNNALESMDLVTDPKQKAQLEGEAYFIRGIVYFELIRLYAQPWGSGDPAVQPGVPLVLRATKTETQAFEQQPRASVAEVYNRVLSDLTRAEQLLPADNGTRADKFTAAAFLSRVYLQRREYANALAAANRVITSGSYRLNPVVTIAFRNRNTPESIFEIQQNDQNNAGTANDGMATFYASLPGVGRGDVRVLEGFAGLYGPTDTRSTELIYRGTGRRSGRLRSSKWTEFGQNLPIIRLAEMLLIRAECNLQLGTEVGATPLEDVNTIRRRAGAEPYTTISIDRILLERQLELAFEGVRVHDIKRTQGSTGTYAWNDPKLVFPIPQRELDANSSLQQNSGY